MNLKTIVLFSFSCSLFTIPFNILHAAVPLRWTVETSAANPATFDQFAGATYDLEATLQSRGKPLAVTGDPKLYWQTNGMGSAWWTAPATVSGNVLRATWTPACDVGARVYNCFIGITGTVYNAAFQLRLRPSPGAIPNELPLPTPVVDFSKVTVLNPPWPSGSARPLPRYLHYLEFDDTYPDDAAWYYAQPQDYGGCSAVRDGGFLSRNYDWRLDDAAEFVVRMSAGPAIEQSNNPNNRTIRHRFASIGVANCGTNLTETFVTSGKPSRYYKCLPGRTVDGINETGVVCEVNVVDGIPQWRSGVLTSSDIHPLAAVRWALDNGTSAGMVASNLAARIMFPPGWTQNFHWMVADAAETWIVENGAAHLVDATSSSRPVMTNFRLYPSRDTTGAGQERYNLLVGGGPITNAWFTCAYSRSTFPPWESEFKDASEMEAAMSAWETHSREQLRGKGLWQTVHCSIYDITNRILRISVQEQPDWYTFALRDVEGKVREIVQPIVQTATNGLRHVTDLTVYDETFSEWEYSGDPDVIAILKTCGFSFRYIEAMDTYMWELDHAPPVGWIETGCLEPGDATRLDWEMVYELDPNPDTSVRVATLTRKKMPVPTEDRLATTIGVNEAIANKRDLDDLSYVTAVPGGWQPTEVDGHRYDIYYDGYSGWYVEKLTYYPEWGEWYYDDSEFVAGPADAETLTAHKIWSDETITFTRQQVEVTDSLALVSQIGNQAEVAARNYIQNNDIAKTKTLLRTGKPGEYGTGWGTMHYQFSSDRRWWSMIVPTLTASWSTGGYVDTNGTYVTASTVHFPGRINEYYRADPISQRDHTPVARFVSSAGTNGSARCGSATWSVGITAGPGTSSSSVRFDNSADIDAMPFLVTAGVDHAAGFGSARLEDRSAFPPIEFSRTDYRLNRYVLSNFRYGEATVTNRSVSVKCLYDVDVQDVSGYVAASIRTNFTAWCTLSLGCSAESYVTTNPDYGRVLTDTTRGLYWDSGMRATWRVNVTNGCFFAEIISTNNLAEGVN